jgi:cobalt-precorrin-5B (C1)-methyltransferase
MITQVKRSKHRNELRSGFTTGACAAAASRAAVHYLLTAEAIDEVNITLPNKEQACFTLCRLERHPEGVLASIVKDGGDDPDCTHGIEIQCMASWHTEPGIHIDGGLGVAKVTLAGLELPVGMAAINPVPRQNIHDMVMVEWRTCAPEQQLQPGLKLEIRVPEGERCAKQTISERLGLIGGISILGTRGTVKPYSTSAFSASVRQSVQVASANGLNHVVLTTGSRSERSAMAMLPKLSAMAFIQAGDFLGVGLRASKRYRVEKATVVAMIGKLGKMVGGHMMTHVSGHKTNFTQLADIAAQHGANASLCEQITHANTGRHVLELVKDEPILTDFLQALCCHAAKHASQYVTDNVAIEFRLIDFDGSLLAQYPLIGQSPTINTTPNDEDFPMNDMQQLTRQGRQIEEGSFAIIDREIEQIHGGHSYSAAQWNVVRRAIHTTGDFEFAKLFRFSPDAAAAGMAALKAGAPIITDVTMITSGLSAQRLAVYGNQAHCFISDPKVIEIAKQEGQTRAIWAMRKARDQGLLDGAIVGIGNAPTALYELLRMVADGEVRPALIIGIPVGFVKAEESKQALAEQTAIPYIASLGRKGGSPLVVSTIHALLTESV